MNSLPQISPMFAARSRPTATIHDNGDGAKTAQKAQPLAERMRFELTIGFPLYALSRGHQRSEKPNIDKVKHRSLGCFPQFSPSFKIFTGA